MSTPLKIGIIGGSGLDDPDILQNRKEEFVETPFGKPSDALIHGHIDNVPCVLLARHGRKHSVMPTNINFRANVWALKEAGCTHLVVTTACGSLQEHLAPGDIVLLDQFIDRTTKRVQTFYDDSYEGCKGVCHTPFHTPFCERTRQVLVKTAKGLGVKFHETGTMISIEGPRFSSRAESKLWKSWGADLINMTTVPEVVLAKEAGLSYAAIALVTDYDSWRDVGDEGHVSVESVLEVFKGNASKAKNILLAAVPKIAAEDWSETIAKNQALVKSSIM